MDQLLKKVTVLEPENPNKSTALFGGRASGILNWNDLAYPHFYDFREQIRSLFWRASEVDMTHDIKQFPNLSSAERNAFLKIIGLLATLDGLTMHALLQPEWMTAQMCNDVLESHLAGLASYADSH